MQAAFRLCLLLVLMSVLAGRGYAAKIEIDASERTDLDLTVYSSGFAVIRDTRETVLPRGELELEFIDVARTVDAPSVSLKSDAGTGFVADQQNYRFDLINRVTLLERFIGRKVKYSRSLLENGTYERVFREGILLSINPEIVKFGDIIEVQPQGTISLPYIPDDLRTTPTLFFKGENSKKGKQALEVRYHADAVGWEADYALTLHRRGPATLTGWVTVTNHTGKNFEVSGLRFIAGDVRREKTQMPKPEMMSRALMAADSAPGAAVTRVGDQHAYDYPGSAMLFNNEVTQLRLVTSEEVDVEKSYRISSSVQQYSREGTDEPPVGVFYSFVNSKGNDLSLPLPAGRVRVYETGEGDSHEFVGEDRIDHSPRNEVIEAGISHAFDLRAERRQTSFRRLGERSVEVGYTLAIRSEQDTDVIVRVDERFPGEWDMLRESAKSERVDARTARYEVKVPSGGTYELTYVARISW